MRTFVPERTAPDRTIGVMTIAAVPGSRYRAAGVIAGAVVLAVLGGLLYAFGGIMLLASLLALGPEDEVGPAAYLLPVGGGSVCIVLSAYLLIRLLARRR